jgi:hypothetical protein
MVYILRSEVNPWPLLSVFWEASRRTGTPVIEVTSPLETGLPCSCITVHCGSSRGRRVGCRDVLLLLICFLSPERKSKELRSNLDTGRSIPPVKKSFKCTPHLRKQTCASTSHFFHRRMNTASVLKIEYDDVTSQMFQTDKSRLRFMLLQLYHGFHS